MTIKNILDDIQSPSSPFFVNLFIRKMYREENGAIVHYDCGNITKTSDCISSIWCSPIYNSHPDDLVAQPAPGEFISRFPFLFPSSNGNKPINPNAMSSHNTRDKLIIYNLDGSTHSKVTKNSEFYIWEHVNSSINRPGVKVICKISVSNGYELLDAPEYMILSERGERLDFDGIPIHENSNSRLKTEFLTTTRNIKYWKKIYKKIIAN